MAENPFAAPVQVQSASTGLQLVEQQRAVAEVQARMIIARANPRDPRHAMDLILQDCTRVSLAEVALYEYARGGTDISGPSIKLAETVARRWGNIASGIKELSRRDGFSECVAYAWDLESGYYDERQFQVRHWRDRKGGGGYRVNDERDIYELVANMGQRRKRAVLLSVIPGDVIEAAVQQCEETLQTEADTSPEALKRLVEAFVSFGVTQVQIEARCQRRLEAIRPAQIVQLRKIWASLRDEMSQPSDWFDVAPTAPAQTTGNEALRSRLERTAAEPVGVPSMSGVGQVGQTGEPLSGGSVEAPEPHPQSVPADRSREEANPTSPAPPEGVPLEVVPVPRRGRGWDWRAYADVLIATGKNLPRERLEEFRIINANQLQNLRISFKEDWSRVLQALAEYEREGA